MMVTGFLASLPSEYDTVKSQILSSHEISSPYDTFNRMLYLENSHHEHPLGLLNNALLNKKATIRKSSLGGETRGLNS